MNKNILVVLIILRLLYNKIINLDIAKIKIKTPFIEDKAGIYEGRGLGLFMGA